ncbi:hypothetical protein RRG08_036945 [Elysia crispata]|uniref:Uncharacterized protein n=1 Tax=Elysia crispata TaxID=231223 RepID=A0AAE0YXX2_9GAST|nr:hypothetical protein RRG08_036945 [Elysia crispata]
MPLPSSRSNGKKRTNIKNTMAIFIFTVVLLVTYSSAAVLPASSSTGTSGALSGSESLPAVDLSALAAVAAAVEASDSDSIGSSADSISSGSSADSISSAQDKLSEVVSSVQDSMSEVVDSAQDAASDVLDTAMDKVEDVVDAAQDTTATGAAADVVTDAVDDLRDAITDVVDGMEDIVTETSDDTQETVSDITDDTDGSTTDILDDISDAAEDATEDVLDEVTDAVEDLEDAITDAADNTQDATEDVLDQISDMITTDSAEDTSDLVEEILTGATPGGEEGEPTDHIESPITDIVEEITDDLGDSESHSGQSLDFADHDESGESWLSQWSRVKQLMDLLEAGLAESQAAKSGTCPRYPVHVGTDSVTVTTHNGCKIVIKLRGATVDGIHSTQDNLTDGPQLDRSIEVSYHNDS